jgi:hypothetical protein
MGSSKETLSSRGIIESPNVEVMHSGKSPKLVVTKAMATVVKQGKLTIASLHGRTAALKQISAFTGDLLDVNACRWGKLLQRMVGLA